MWIPNPSQLSRGWERGLSLAQEKNPARYYYFFLTHNNKQETLNIVGAQTTHTVVLSCFSNNIQSSREKEWEKGTTTRCMSRFPILLHTTEEKGNLILSLLGPWQKRSWSCLLFTNKWCMMHIAGILGVKIQSSWSTTTLIWKKNWAIFVTKILWLVQKLFLAWKFKTVTIHFRRFSNKLQ